MPGESVKVIRMWTHYEPVPSKIVTIVNTTMKVSVILPAAGLGTRMGREKSGTSRKQFMLLEGAPILVHTTRKFAHVPRSPKSLSPCAARIWSGLAA